MSTEAVYSETERARARELHDRVVSFDSHIDLPAELKDGILLDGETWPGQFDLERASRGRLSGASLVIQGQAVHPTAENKARAREGLEVAYSTIGQIADKFSHRAGLARNPAEFHRLAAEGKFAIVQAFQNAAPLEDLSALEKWLERDIAVFALTFVGNNQWADSARPYPFFGGDYRSDGLSALGRAAVGRLNDRGVVIDVTQLSSAALADVLAITRSPVVASHSGLRAIVDIDRNLHDRELRALRDNGGVVQIVGFATYLRTPGEEKQQRQREVWRRYGLDGPTSLADSYSVNDPATKDWTEDRFWKFLHEWHAIIDHANPDATIADFVNAIDHAVEIAGIDHVGISSDFNHGGGLIGWRDVADNIDVTAELLRRGYSDTEIAKLWGENFFRVWQAALDRRR